MMIRVSMTSERTHGLFPNHSIATIYPPGANEFFSIDVNEPYSGYDRKFVARMNRDNKMRECTLNGPSFDFDAPTITHILNPAFTTSFNLSFHDFICILNSAIEGCEPNKVGFPIPFVPVRLLVGQLAAQGVPEQSARRIFAGFSVSPDRLKSDRRVIWKPQQESRAYRRAFFEFPHTSGDHFCFSKSMAMESLLYLVQGTSFPEKLAERMAE